MFAASNRLIMIKLLADTETGDDGTVTLDVGVDEGVEKSLSLADHFQQAASGVVVVLVLLQMLGEVVDSLGENRNLHFGRTCVALVCGVLFDDGFFFCFQHSETPLEKNSMITEAPSRG